MKIEVVNLQKIRKIDLKEINSYVKKIFAVLRREKYSLPKTSLNSLRSILSGEVSFVLCDNNFIKRLNRKFFGRNCPTDTISFPLRDKFDNCCLGEVIISIEEAVKNAALFKKSWKEEMILYIIHGILHLLGYNDARKRQQEIMEKEQDKIMKKLFT